ncbi:hypothetical protein ABZX12_08015 [Kribbella sp. NPDC003505]|uniref:hypothetical protein n=1 Tax=Kribbella sp. NPDC003505 TaxID=3154448 RepID=UPI0033AA5027
MDEGLGNSSYLVDLGDGRSVAAGRRLGSTYGTETSPYSRAAPTPRPDESW